MNKSCGYRNIKELFLIDCKEMCIRDRTDTGPILLQKAVETQPDDTPEILQRRVMEQAEWKILPEAIDLIANGKVTVKDGRTVITQ